MMIRTEKSKSSSYNTFNDKNKNKKKKKKKKKKISKLSESEMEAARQLIELSNGDSSSSYRAGGGDIIGDNNSSNNSFSSVQGRPQEKRVLENMDICFNVEGTMVDDDDDDDIISMNPWRRRKSKRYRFVLDLYNVTKPVISW